jgi:hypothetical protein
MDVSMTGDLTGTMYVKDLFGSVETPVLGTITVNPDCSYSSIFQMPEFDVTLAGRGVFFNEGKEFYGLALGDPRLPPDQQWLKFSFAYGKR